MTTDQQSSGLDFPEMTESKPKTHCLNRLRNIITTPNAYNLMGQLLHNKNSYYQSANTGCCSFANITVAPMHTTSCSI